MKIYYNTAAGDSVKCINVNSQGNQATRVVDYLWGYMVCTTMAVTFGYSGDLANGGDMLYNDPVERNCQRRQLQELIQRFPRSLLG